MKKKLLSHILMVATILTSYTVGTMQPTQLFETECAYYEYMLERKEY